MAAYSSLPCALFTNTKVQWTNLFGKLAVCLRSVSQLCLQGLPRPTNWPANTRSVQGHSLLIICSLPVSCSSLAVSYSSLLYTVFWHNTHNHTLLPCLLMWTWKVSGGSWHTALPQLPYSGEWNVIQSCTIACDNIPPFCIYTTLSLKWRAGVYSNIQLVSTIYALWWWLLWLLLKMAALLCWY